MTKGKGLIRSLNRSGSATGKLRPAEARTGRLPEPVVCDCCGAIFARRVWRRDANVTHALLGRAAWKTCPACRQTSRDEYLGRVLIRGDLARAKETAIRRRIANVAEHGERTQPERRIVSIERQGDALEVLTTSQKLAHRIVHELKKVFGGKASYAWSDDGSLFATWRTEPARG